MKFTALIISTVVSLSTVSETSEFVLQPTFTLKKSIVPSGLNSSSIKTISHFKTIQVNRGSKGMSMNQRW
jgi:hypothetical protein